MIAQQDSKPPEKSPRKPSPQDWKQFFREKKPSNDSLREMVLELTKSHQPEEVIGLLEQSLLHGYSEPWMYPVLAVNMEMAGRPKAQIERVLLSNSDVVNSDPETQLFLAAYLTRLGRYEQALQLCRHASQVAPERPEPYVRACELASRHQLHDAAYWVAPGVLQYAWVAERAKLVEQAEQLARNAETHFLRSNRPDRVLQLQAALENARRCDLLIRLEWHGDSNLDLIVEEPWGTRCWGGEPRTSSGGILVREDFGLKSSVPNQVGQPHQEEYACPIAASGEYRLRVRYHGGNVIGKRAQLTVIRHAGTRNREELTFSIPVTKDDQIVLANLSEGRRESSSAPLSLKLNPEPPLPLQPVLREVRPGNGMVPVGDAVMETGGQRSVGGVGARVLLPVTTVLSEGVSMNTYAIVSGDRRYVRITAQPVFRSLTDVFVYTFSP